VRRIGAHALLVAIGLSACAAPPARDLDTIVRSLSEGRAVEGRIFGLRAHRPYRDSSARKSPLPSLSQAALAAVQRLSQGRVRAMEPDLRAAAGAELLVGRSDKAFALLLEALDRDPVSAAVWNDLAVAHLALAGEQAEPAEELTRALDAAERAVELAPNAAEGWFNLGLAASRLSLRRETQKAWLRATQLEPSGPWRDEVVARMRTADASPSQGPAASKPGEDSHPV